MFVLPFCFASWTAYFNCDDARDIRAKNTTQFSWYFYFDGKVQQVTFLLFPSISPLNLSSLESLKDANNIFLGEPSSSATTGGGGRGILPILAGEKWTRYGERWRRGGGKLMVGLRRVRRVASSLLSLPPTNRLVCVVVVGGL